MAVRGKEELLNSLKNVLGDITSDETISLLEDINDTISDYEEREAEDWKTKYEENDRSWRERYTARFFDGDGGSGGTTVYVEGDVSKTEEEETVDKNIDELFA